MRTDQYMLAGALAPCFAKSYHSNIGWTFYQISSVEITLFLLADILLQYRALFQC